MYDIQFLKRADQAYLEGHPLISDADYDKIRKDLAEQFPDHPYFRTVGANVRGSKVDLPYPMGSLDQIYEDDVDGWINKYSLFNRSINITDKLDGISCMLIYKNGSLSEAYSRGNGIQGADITRHMKHIRTLPKAVSGYAYLAVRAEIIMKKQEFSENFAEEFSNARSMIAGCANRSDSYEEVFKLASVVAYEIVETSKNKPKTKVESLKLLEDNGFEIPYYENILGNQVSSSELVKILRDRVSKSPYELDGIVLTIDDPSGMVSQKNSSDLNPEFSVKFKAIDPNSVVQAEVLDVHWEVSKSGFYKPRVRITPVNLFGTVVTYATGFNARFITENEIGVGAKILITKGGSVIPDIVSVVEPAENIAQPNGPWMWNENSVEAIVPDVDNHPEVKFKRVLDFFETLEVDNLKEASLKAIFDSLNLHVLSTDQCIQTIVDMVSIEFVNIIGANGIKIHESLNRRLENMKPEVFLGAWYQFGFGFGVRKAKALLAQIGGIDNFWSLTVSNLENLDGFNTKTAIRICEGIPAVKLIYDAWIAQKIMKFEDIDKTEELNGLNIVLTGFRDSEFQQKLENMGAKISSGVSSKTTHLVCAALDSGSSKYKKALQLGVTVVTLSEFKDEYNL